MTMSVLIWLLISSGTAVAGDQLLNVPPERMIKAPVYGFTFEVNLVAGQVLLGPPTCEPATQEQIQHTYNAGSAVVASGTMKTWDIKEKLLLDAADRILLRSGAYAKSNGEPKVMQDTYFDSIAIDSAAMLCSGRVVNCSTPRGLRRSRCT